MKKISLTSLPAKMLASATLFEGIAKGDLPGMLRCLDARAAAYEAGETVFLAGDAVRGVGIVCSGEVQVLREDIFGNRTIQAQLTQGEIFGETLACARVEVLPVSVVATTPSEILIIDYRRIVTTCTSSCAFHKFLIENMLGILAGKNLMLNRKIEVLSARTTRAKLTAYLSSQAQRTGSARFRIPFDRQELADYLAVDRSAMSTEMGRMRDEGLLRFKRNEFELLTTRRPS